MANEGTISYQVEIDTAATLTAGRQVNGSLDDMQKGFDKTDKSAGKLNSTMNDGGKAASGFASRLTPLAAAVAGVISVQTIAQWGKMAEQFTLFQARIQRLSPDIETARASYQSLLNIASTTGATMADTTRLWESLTTTLKSLGATNSQVLTLTSTLQKIGTIGGSSAEETSNALRQLSQGLAAGTLRAEEFNSIIENTPELARQIGAGMKLSMGELRTAMLNGQVSAEALFDALLNRSAAVNAEFEKLPRTVTQASNAIQTQFGAALAIIDKAIGASQKLAAVLDGIAKGIQLTFNPSDQQKFAELLQKRSEAEQQYQTQLQFGLKSSAAATKTRIDGLNSEIKALQDKRVAEQKAEAGANGGGAAGAGPKTTSDDGQKAIQQLAEQNALLRAQGEERVRIQALQKVGANSTKEERDLAVALALDSYRLAEAEKDRAKAKTDGANAAKKAETEAAQLAKKSAAEQKQAYEQNQKAVTDLATALSLAGLSGRELAQAQALLRLNKFATPEDIANVKALADATYDLSAAKNAEKLAGSVDPFVGAQQGLEQQLADIKTIEEAQIISKQRADELRLQSETAYQEQVMALEAERFAQASLGNELLMSGIDALANSGTQALSGLLSGTTSLKDAMGGIANTVLNTVIGAFVQMGVDWVKQQIIMAAAAQSTTAAQVGGIAAVTTAQAGATASIAATTTTTAATTGTAVASSMAPAAGLSSIASFGGAAVIGGAALLATMLLAKSFSGKALGGPVQANGMYRVNETGAPEIFNAANGRQYMMPNQRGEVVSNKDATAGGGSAAPIVNINNYSGQAATASSKWSDADRRFIIDVVVGDMQAGGKSGQTVNQVTGTRRAGS
ncbi:hypothetical protein D3C77_246720 [compost metagenome]